MTTMKSTMATTATTRNIVTTGAETSVIVNHIKTEAAADKMWEGGLNYVLTGVAAIPMAMVVADSLLCIIS